MRGDWTSEKIVLKWPATNSFHLVYKLLFLKIQKRCRKQNESYILWRKGRFEKLPGIDPFKRFSARLLHETQTNRHLLRLSLQLTNYYSEKSEEFGKTEKWTTHIVVILSESFDGTDPVRLFWLKSLYHIKMKIVTHNYTKEPMNIIRTHMRIWILLTNIISYRFC